MKYIANFCNKVTPNITVMPSILKVVLHLKLTTDASNTNS